MKNVNGRRSNDYEFLVTGGRFGGGALRRHSCETCYSNSSSSSGDKRMSLLSTHDDIFTISSQSPLSAYSSGYYSNANSSLLDSCEMQQQQQECATKTRIWSLRPDSLLHHSKCLFSPLLPSIKTRVDFISEEDSSSTSTLLLIEDEVSKKIDVISMTESFDSGFGGGSGGSVVIDMVSSPTSSCSNLSAATHSANYLVVEQTKPRSLFHYLFDLSHLIRDALFEWPTTYVRKLKENLVSLGSHNRQASIKWRPFSRSSQSSSSLSKRVRQCAQNINSKNNSTQSNVIDKPIGIMGLLSKLNLFSLVETFNIFNLFRSTVTSAAANSAMKSSSSTTASASSSFPYGYNPLRDFLLRLFDINFF